jgi:serine carboxypeptidase-like clade 2
MEDDQSEFHLNDFSWNKEANMLYIESPAGVGFSYCDSQRYCQFNDETSAQDNLDTLLLFYQKFPELRKNDLYISGESYAGIYVPYLAYQID